MKILDHDILNLSPPSFKIWEQKIQQKIHIRVDFLSKLCAKLSKQTLLSIQRETRVKYLHGNLWKWMEFHGNPWRSMEFHETPMEYPWSIHGVPWNAMEFHGVPWSSDGVPWNAMKFHGISWSSMECHGVPWSTDAVPWNAIACPWSSIEYHAVCMRKSIEIQ